MKNKKLVEEVIVVPMAYKITYHDTKHKAHLIREIGLTHLDISGAGIADDGEFYSYSVKCLGIAKDKP